MFDFTDSGLAGRGLPQVAYVVNKGAGFNQAPVIGIKRGYAGYHPVWTGQSAGELNRIHNVTEVQAQAMYAGSLYGWDCAESYPDFYRKEKA